LPRCIAGFIDLGCQASTGATDIFLGAIVFCSSTVPMDLINPAVDLGIFVGCLGKEHFEDSFVDTPLTPAHWASVNHPKVANVFG